MLAARLRSNAPRTSLEACCGSTVAEAVCSVNVPCLAPLFLILVNLKETAPRGAGASTRTVLVLSEVMVDHLHFQLGGIL
jgi:hypothetical protein